ncbi:methylated-DNA-[protein]-cysteine S-methyltransferase [Kitasatospora sp. MAP12-15]|uniref:methylated-DNA--[protein]-cysteine S-methyltransferase n=1 Tax=unclassified Kitasatospora TaxID=2633591 RepID=UPI00247727FA|nr:methylated-DNA--[protein]-cysteine S-methyltransferase [Kitasatospora sp. MAP12-44]MDH6111227.1 methylated-DNA-[protein]-cysteine S-methyltransferase [Kitasatospora sp. MAP12-44]
MSTTAQLSWITVQTPLPTGPMAIGVTDQGVAAAEYGRSAQTAAGLCADERRIELVTGRLAEYFAGRRRELGLPLDLRLASGPHRVVLETLYRTVPFGETITYGRLAERSGVFEEFTDSPGLAARTVGQMMGANPVALLVPCHRVVAADGIGGFGAGPLGLDVKRWLLTLEGLLPPTLDWNGPL